MNKKFIWDYLSIFTDSKKLSTRIDTHKNYSSYDINEWIMKMVSLKDGESLLDIGCGTGEQLLRFAKNCPSSKILGIDASNESLLTIKKTCQNDGLENIDVIEGNMDDVYTLVLDSKFDVVTSSFALYYSKNIKKIITDIKEILTENGRFFVCGPVPGNNEELINFQASITPSVLTKTKYVMVDEILPEISNKFSKIVKDYFVNPVHFPDASSLVQYWKSYYLYDQNIEQEFTDKIKEYFQKQNKFTSTKKVLGIIAYK
ncbi:MAG: class I SAM-dependent methyltransferase [Candidatus Nitrosotenuis sp.]